jgi:arsenite methyltransferase
MVSLGLDTPTLAAAYDIAGLRHLAHGKMLIADLAIKPHERVLDLGAGTGLLATYAAGIVGRPEQVVAVEPLLHRADLARTKVPSGLDVRLGQAEDLSFLRSNTFDVVYLNSVLHWISDKARALGKIRRVLKPGGRIGLTTAAKERPHDVALVREKALEQCGLAGRTEAEAGRPLTVSSDELRRLLTTNNFHVTQLALRTIVDHAPSAAAVIVASDASAFGNHLSGLSAHERSRVHQAFTSLLETYRVAAGFRLERHLIFAMAEKPTTS